MRCSRPHRHSKRRWAAFRRGDYEEAVADCRPALEALRDAVNGEFNLKPGDASAGKDERFYWVQQSLLRVVHLAHHPNDQTGRDEGPTAPAARWHRVDAEAAISTLAALIHWRMERG